MAMSRTGARFGPIVCAALLAGVSAACGATPTTSQAITTASTSTIGPSGPVPTASPSASPTMPPGTLVLDTVSAVRSMELSPDGKLLAVLVTDKQSNGTVEVFTAAGTNVAAYTGQGFGWVNGALLAVFTPSVGSVNGRVTLHWADGSTNGVPVPLIPGTWGGVLGNGHGSLVLNSAVPQGPYAFGHFQVWSSGSLGPLITAFGTPMAWSPDGSQLVMERSHDTVIHPTGIVLADTGSQDADLYVLRFPGGHPLARFPSGLVVDSPAYFSRDGRYLTANESQLDPHGSGPMIVDLVTGVVLRLGLDATVLGWTPDDRVVMLATDERTVLWGPDGELTGPSLPPGAAAYGPTMSDIAQANPSTDATPRLTVTSSDGTLTVPMLVSPPPSTAVVWTTDGRAVFVDSGSTDAQKIMDQLLRVPVP